MSSFLESDTDESWAQDKVEDKKVTSRSSRRQSNNKPNYTMSSSDESDSGDESSDNDILVDSDEEDKKPPAKKKAVTKAAAKKKTPVKGKAKESKLPSSDESGSDVIVLDSDEDDKKKPAKKQAAAKKTPTPANAAAPSPKKKSPAKMAKAILKNEGKVSAAQKSEKDNGGDGGVDIVIPHAFLKGNKNECTMLVQVEDNDDTSHHLDFHGQSGAIGRFEADGEGGYQYRGIIRPGPTAMIVAMNRDGQLKVEAITDEFVTLDTNTKTDVMAKFDAVVSGDMDDGYKVREENVNIADKKKGGDKDDGNKKGKKRANASKTSSSAPKPKKRKVSMSKKK
eukprot:scaffold33407_cov143-Skeletonema_menzelii.AAC.2